MPSNEQRRATAKRKLERRLERQAAQARRRKQLTIAGSVLGVVLVAAAGVGIYYLTRSDDHHDAAAGQTPDASLSSTPQAAAPPAAKPKPATVTCAYTDGGQAAKPVQKPQTQVGTQGRVAVTLDTSQGAIGLSLDNAESPCTINSFTSLVSQKFFDGTSCHRLTTGPGLDVLQCGDPTGTGSGGPGYQFGNEYPTDQFAPGDPALDNPVQYKRGVVAMANAGPNTNGSQFFLVYGDSQLPPNYTIFGTIDNAGLSTLDKVAKAGVAGGASDGKPAAAVTISSARIG